jgi:hypothetical protein
MLDMTVRKYPIIGGSMENKAANFDSLRKDSKLLKDYGNYLISKRKENRFLDLNQTNKIVKSFVAEKRQGGEKLTALGAMLLIAPDPITDAAAVPVLAAAQILKLRSEKKNDLRRIVEGARASLISLSSL